jgi:hypothetical protein
MNPFSTTPRFRFETDMAAGAIAHFLTSPALYVGAELEIGVRAPDLCFGRANQTVLDARLSGGFALASDLEVRLVERLGAQGASTSELRAWAPWGWRNLREGALASLAARGVVSCIDEHWYVALDARAPFSELVSVELKLTNWRHGLRQAWQNRSFAERSWLLLGNCAPPEAVALARSIEVGLARLDPSGAVDEIVAPIAAVAVCPTAKRLAGEALLAQLLEQRQPGIQERWPLAGSPRGRQLGVGR